MTIRRLTAQLGAWFIPDGQRDLREQFFESLCLAGSALALLVIVPANSFQNMPVVITTGAAVFGLVSYILFMLARRGRHYPGLYFLVLLMVLNVAWFPNAGTHGSIPYYYFIGVGYAVLFFRDSRRWLLSGLVTANVIGLIVLEWRLPGLLDSFSAESDRYIDLLSGFFVSCVACVLMWWVVTSGYERERGRLRVAVDRLTESEERFSRLFQVNPDAVCVMDLDARAFVDVNEGFTRMTGWQRAEAIGRTAVDLDLWVDLEEREQRWASIRRDAQVQNSLTRLRTKDGRIFWASISFGIMEQKSRRHMLLTTRDVTTQIETERAVAESRALLSTLLDSTDDLVWLVDPTDFHLTAFNTAFAAVSRHSLGVDPSPGLALDQVVPAAHVAEWRAFFHRALEQGPFTVEYAVPDTSLIVLYSFNAVRHDGATTGVAVFGKDITERKLAEEERARLEMQLLEAQKMESLGSLAGGVAHDFNNMLGGIMGYTDILLREETDARRHDYLDAILQAATRSSELTRKLLAFGRRGKNVVEPVDLGAIARDSVTMLRPSFRKDTAVELDLRTTSTVDGDPGQLNQLIVNLYINANEAMPSGGRLRVGLGDVTLDESAAAACGLPGGDYVELRVTDTGIGMADDVKTRIFEPFFTTKLRGRAPGTGLGLATVYGVVQLHRGSIAVISAPGQGTTFVVHLPKGTLVSQPSVAPPQTAAGRGLVLVVEDEALLRTLAGRALRSLGYEAVTAADGEEGIAVFRERHRELAGVLLDLKMPRKDGREAFLAFKEIDPHVPVLICSGYGDNEEAQGLISLGARGLLPKPYRVSTLGEMLARLTLPARG